MRSKRVPPRKLYIADLHFFHNNLNRSMDMRGFENYEVMNEKLIEIWNENVNERDEIYILGDFSISKAEDTENILKRLKGKKYLIEGNHDKFLKNKNFDRELFEWIKPYAEIRDNGRKVILSHYPIVCYNGQYKITKKGAPITYMLYGHVHNTRDELIINGLINITRNTKMNDKDTGEEKNVPCNMINCFCMFSDYVPLTLNEWIEVDFKRREQINEFKA